MKIVCPYCLRKVKVNDIDKFCNVCGDKLNPTYKDMALLALGKKVECRTRTCPGQYSTLKCPYCESILPNDIAQYDKYLRFSVVAPAQAGKTNFLTAMIEEAKKARELNFVIAPMNTETLDLHNSNYESMYKLRQRIVTKRGEVTPMQWRFQDMNRATRNTVPPYSVTIFDGAGEDQSQLDPAICRYIAGSKMIMLLLDPTKLYGVRKFMTDAEIINGGGTTAEISYQDTQNFIEGMINYLKTACGISASKKISINVAVVFGKIDVVARHLGSVRVLTPSQHVQKDAFVQSEADAIDAEISSWLAACGDNLTSLFDANFTKWRYFGVSSFGVMPDSAVQKKEPMPLRVLDPLMWNLALEGIVDFEN